MNHAVESNRVDENGAPEPAALPTDTSSASAVVETERVAPGYFASFLRVLDDNQFPLLILLAILVAKAYPAGGAFLKPDITSTWVAVIVIFLVSGMCLRAEELAKAFQRLYFNAFVQIFNFGFVSVATYSFSKLLVKVGAINPALGDGLVVCSCLPMAINVVIVLTAAAGGDEASAIFNTTLGNIIGIFLTPAMILLYLGASGDMALGEVFYKLTVRVIVPLVVGLGLRMCSEHVACLVKDHKNKFKRLQEYALVFIVYIIFCQTFRDGTGAEPVEIVVIMLSELLLLLLSMATAWILAGQLSFANDPKLRVVALYGCSGKTIALGIPLINSIYEHDPQEGLYTIPLLIWYLLHLLIGSFLSSRLESFVKNEEARCKAMGGAPSAPPSESSQGEEAEITAVDDIEMQA